MKKKIVLFVAALLISTVCHADFFNAQRAVVAKKNAAGGAPSLLGAVGLINPDTNTNDTIGNTVLQGNAVAEATGSVNVLKFQTGYATGSTSIYVGSFHNTSGTDYDTVDDTGETTLVISTNPETFDWSAPGDFTSFSVNAGDLIGCYIAGNYTTRSDYNASGGSLKVSGNQVGNDGITYESYPRDYYLYGEIYSASAKLESDMVIVTSFGRDPEFPTKKQFIRVESPLVRLLNTVLEFFGLDRIPAFWTKQENNRWTVANY